MFGEAADLLTTALMLHNSSGLLSRSLWLHVCRTDQILWFHMFESSSDQSDLKNAFVLVSVL